MTHKCSPTWAPMIPYYFSVWLSQEWLTPSGEFFCFPEPTYITMAPPACGSLDNCTLGDKSCPFGFRLDSSGCRTCSCETRKWAETSLEKCFIFLSPYTRCQAVFSALLSRHWLALAEMFMRINTEGQMDWGVVFMLRKAEWIQVWQISKEKDNNADLNDLDHKPGCGL